MRIARNRIINRQTDRIGSRMLRLASAGWTAPTGCYDVACLARTGRDWGLVLREVYMSETMNGNVADYRIVGAGSGKVPSKFSKSGKVRKDNRTRPWFTLRVELHPDFRERLITKTTGKSGLGVYTFLSLVFECNEKLPRAKKMTDETIRKLVLAEFSGRKKKKTGDEYGIVKNLRERKQTINEWRNRYNLGRLTGAIPLVRSNRYTEYGQLANGRSGRPIKKKKDIL